MQQLSFIYNQHGLYDVRLYRREGIAKRERTKLLRSYGFFKSVIIVPANRMEALLGLCSSNTEIPAHLALKALREAITITKPVPGICQYCGNEEQP